MDIRQLQYFVEVADCGSYSLASQKLFVSQPALSKAIKNVEEEIGFSFFYTFQRKQKLTDEGKAFYEKTVKFLESYKDLIDTTYVDANVDKGHINVGLSIMGGPALFLHILPRFKERYPNITISIMERETTILKEELLKKTLDLAFIDLYHLKTPEDSDNFNIFPLVRSDMVVVTSVKNEMAKLHEVQYSELDEKQLILFNAGKGYSGQVENDMKKMGLRPNIVLSSSQWNLIMEMVSADMGVALCPYYIYKRFENPTICSVPLNEEMGKRVIGLIVNKESYRTRACSNFLQYASDVETYAEIKDLFLAR